MAISQQWSKWCNVLVFLLDYLINIRLVLKEWYVMLCDYGYHMRCCTH